MAENKKSKHADTYHIAKAVEYELLFYEWERLEATA